MKSPSRPLPDDERARTRPCVPRTTEDDAFSICAGQNAVPDGLCLNSWRRGEAVLNLTHGGK